MSLAWYRRHLWETVTYWAPPTHDVYNDDTFTTPTTMKARWQDRKEEFIDWRGEVTLSNALVFLAEEVLEGGYLYFGTSSSTTPKSLEGAYPIRRARRMGGYRESDGYFYVVHL